MNPNSFPVDDTRGVPKCEAALLGSIILDPTCLNRVGPIVSASDFNDPGYAELFAALHTLHDAGKPVADLVWLTAELARLGLPEELRTEFGLYKLTQAAVHAGHAVYYAEQVATAAQLRRLVSVGMELQANAGAADAEPAVVRNWLDSKLTSLDRSQPSEMRLIEEVAEDAVRAVDTADDKPTRPPGLMSGIERLDSAAGAMMPGEVVIIAARTGCGKTSLATQIAEHTARRSRPALMVSLEMRGAELAMRMLCGHAEIDSRVLRSSRLDGNARQRLREAKEQFSGLPFRIWAPPSATLAEIRGIGRYAKVTSDLQLLVVDYIGLVKPSPDEKRLQRYEQVSAVSAGLKALAKELDVVVIALAQLNREADGMEPKLSHLRESGSIEQDADAVWLIHHPPATGPAASGDVYAKGCSLIVAKHRHGETGRVPLLWHPSETRFSSPSPF